MVTIREERSDDADDIRAINEAAFAQPAEARLVDLLRASGDAFLSLVAETNGRVVGHILFTPVSGWDLHPWPSRRNRSDEG